MYIARLRRTEAARRASEAKALLGAAETQPLKQSMLLRGSADAGVQSMPALYIHAASMALCMNVLAAESRTICIGFRRMLTGVHAVTVAFGGITTGAGGHTHNDPGLAGPRCNPGAYPSGTHP